MVSRNLLGGYEGQSMAQICPNGFDATNQNHCAHFVAHVLQLNFGVTCASLRGASGSLAAANVRVQEIFARCPRTREVLECPSDGEGLLFVSERKNFRGTPTRIRNVPKKHIGILLNGIVWHYSNSRNRVVKQPAYKFLRHYPGQQNAIFWGAFPAAARPTSIGTCR